jgi:glucokinase
MDTKMKENIANVNRKAAMPMTRGMLLAGDIGGTKTLLGLFESSSARPQPLSVRTFATLEYDDLLTIIAEFVAAEGAAPSAIEAACFGVAGPVIDEAAELTNVPFKVDARRVMARFKFARVTLLNDLQAMAYSVPVLTPPEVHVLQEGQALKGGNIAVIAAGTGLGEAMLHYVTGRGFVPSPSEGGHADFSARTEREIVLLRDIVARYGRAEVESVLCGPGLVNIFRVTHHGRCDAAIDIASPEAPAAISTAALERRCDGCVEALNMFVDAYGAESGNLALRVVATAGVYIGGGIAPKILPALSDGTFMRAFRGKPPLEAMLEAMPVKVILNAEAGLLGAAVYAAQQR